MKFVKILALVLAVCLMSAAFVACDNGGKEKETEAEKVELNVKVIVKNGSEKVYEEDVVYSGTDATLGSIIAWMCEVNLDVENAQPFDSNGLLTTIGTVTGSNWYAYYEDSGSNNTFDSIKNQEIENGKTIVIVCK